MTNPSRRGGPWLAVVFMMLATYMAAGRAAAEGLNPPVDQPDFSAVLQAQAPALARVTSDTEALALFTKSLGPSLGVTTAGAGAAQNRSGQSGGARTGKPKGTAEAAAQPPAAEAAEAAVRLTGELAAWRLAAALTEAAGKEGSSLAAVLAEAAPQREWLAAGGTTRASLLRALAMADLLLGLEPKPAGAAPDQGPAAQSYEEYAASLDRAIPLLNTEGQDSWVGLAEREGLPGIRRRLGEGDQPMAERYWKARLKPVFLARLAALAIRAETEAERESGRAWQKLRAWPDRLQQEKGLAKLCGSWQWTLHNHQNHQDHKMVMRFEPPFTQPAGNAAPGQPMLKPAKIVVLGDAVYLRWESAAGAQEDSLLFTGEGKRLEGSFVNSAGAWGSITGKRLTACRN